MSLLLYVRPVVNRDRMPSRRIQLQLLLLMFHASTAAATYHSLIISPKRKSYLKSLTKYTFKRPPSYNSASLPTFSIQTSREIDRYLRNPRSVGSIDSYKLRYWSNLDAFFRRLSQFVSVSIDKITLHDRTTSAIRGALDYLKTDSAWCLYTNLEYPTVIDSIKERFNDNAHVINLEKEIWSGSFSTEMVSNKIISKVEALVKENENGIICLSHICYSIGYLLTTKDLVEKLSIFKRVHLIIDGAQAVGNIKISNDLLKHASFYAFCCHKWMLGEPTLGVLISNYELLEKSRSDVIKKLVKSRPYSYINQEFEKSTLETVDLKSYISTNASLEDLIDVGAMEIDKHNTDLGKLSYTKVDA